MSEWRVGRRHYGYRVYEGTRPVANFREEEDAALAVRLHNDHVNANPDAPRGRAATADDTGAYPGEAAAVEAALACADDNDWRALTRKTVTAMLAAARPEIAAAEGERIAQEIEAHAPRCHLHRVMLDGCEICDRQDVATELVRIARGVR